MRIDPTAPNLVMPESPSSRGNLAPAAAPSPDSSSNAAEHVRTASDGWQSPQHEVNVVLNENQRIVYKFVDKGTGEVVEQIPPEESLRLIENIQQLLEKSKGNLKVTG